MSDSTCTKCKTSIPEGGPADPSAAKYPVCDKCWHEWKEYSVIVMNEMRLDMSMLDHRKLLKKHEKIFVGVMSADGEVIDYANEDNRAPDQPPAGGVDTTATASDASAGDPSISNDDNSSASTQNTSN